MRVLNFKQPAIIYLLLLLVFSPVLGAPFDSHWARPQANASLGYPLMSQRTPALTPSVSAYLYDEQVGVTFTQNQDKLAFNVTAVAYTDNGVGPGYLVNGLTNSGYWYQVGLSYNWPYTSGAITPGFNMNYEVFDPSGASIYPPNNGGGVQPLNWTVNPGDSVFLSLSFVSNSVVMSAFDWQTKAFASQTYHAYGNIFEGLPFKLDSQGFFSGLMTEAYHRTKYFGSGLPVTYSDSPTNMSSVWMWMDEWNTDTGASVFKDNTTSPVTTATSLGQYFSSNGTAEVAFSHGLVTGLTPVSFPTLSSGPVASGSPGHQAIVPINVQSTESGTIRLVDLRISTGFGIYNLSLGGPFNLSFGSNSYDIPVNIPAGASSGKYKLTIEVESWQYLETQAQQWIPLQPARLNQTLLVTNTPTPSNPPGSNQNPPTSGAKTATTLASILGTTRSFLLPIIAGYVALVLVGCVLMLRRRKGPSNITHLGLRFCHSCGTEIDPDLTTCSKCGSLQVQPRPLSNV